MTTKPVLSDVMSAGTSEVLGLGGAAAVPGIAAPVMSITGGTTDTSLTPELNGGVFTLTGGASDTHQNTDWEIATEPTFAAPTWQALASVSLETITVGLALGDATSYYLRARYRGTTYLSEWSAALAFNTLDVVVTAPTVTAPTDLATDIGETPTITSSAFAVTGGSDTHLHSDWEVASDSGFVTVVASSYDDTVNKESWTVGSGLLSVSTTYYVRVRHSGTAEGDSAWSPTISFTTASSFQTAETTALLAQMTTQPNAARKSRIDALIVGLKTDGIWSKLDALWVMAAHDAQAARLNWMNPTGTTLTEVNSPAFDIDQGYTGDGTSARLDTGYIPSTDGVNLTQNSGCFGVWVNKAGSSAFTAYGGARNENGGGTFSITSVTRAANGSGWYAYLNNDSSVTATTASENATGLLCVNRDTTTLAAHRNSTEEASASKSSTYNLPRQLRLLAEDNRGTIGSHSDGQISFSWVGGSLTATERSNLYTRLNTYMTGL